MSVSLLPNLSCQSILDLTPERLHQLGITLLLADLDNTLVKYGQTEPTAELLAWRADLRANGIDLFLVSNSRKPTRVHQHATALDIPYVGHAGKPKAKGFLQAMAQMNRKPEETAMVGDQIFTDIAGARNAGIRAILVEPIALAGNPGRYIRYAIELPFRSISKKRGGLWQ